jgi:hypothetical protein
MPAATNDPSLTRLSLANLDLRPGDLSGDLIRGGIIQAFSSTGILDQASSTSLIVQDNLVIVNQLQVNTINSSPTINGDVLINGHLTAQTLTVDTVFSNNKVEQDLFEFIPKPNSENTYGAGFAWRGSGDYTKLFVLRRDPDRFFSSEDIDLNNQKVYKINGLAVLGMNELGSSVTKSSLREIGQLSTLTVTGDVNLGECIYVNSDFMRIGINTDQPVGILTMTDYEGDVLINIEVEDGRGKIGTYNQKPFDIVAGDQIFLTADPKGVLTLGHEYKGDLKVRAWGKLGINVKNPDYELEVRGPIRFSDKLFMVDNCPPDRGNYRRGDIVWHASPAPGSPIGWVCTAGGQPGVWSPFGIIQG